MADKIELVNIDNVEVAHPGTFYAQTGKVTLTDDTINDFIQNYKDGVYVPYLNLDHDDALTDRVKDALKVNRLGSVSKLWKTGKKLMANFTGVPKGIADKIKGGSMNLRSAEYRKKWIMSADSIKANVLEAVTFFGKGKPAIDLEPYIPVLYKDNPIEQDSEIVSIKLQEEQNMGDITVTEEKYKELLKQVSQVEKLKADDEAKDSKIERLEGDVKTLKDNEEEVIKMKDDAEKKEADIVKAKEADVKTKAVEYADSIIKAEKVEPKYKDKIVGDFIRLQGDDNKEEFELFKEDLEGRNAIKLGKTLTDDSKNTEGEVVELKEPDYEGSSKSRKGQIQLADDEENFYADADKKIKAEMKVQKLTATSENYQKVAIELGLGDGGDK